MFEMIEKEKNASKKGSKDTLQPTQQ